MWEFSLQFHKPRNNGFVPAVNYNQNQSSLQNYKKTLIQSCFKAVELANPDNYPPSLNSNGKFVRTSHWAVT